MCLLVKTLQANKRNGGQRNQTMSKRTTKQELAEPTVIIDHEGTKQVCLPLDLSNFNLWLNEHAQKTPLQHPFLPGWVHCSWTYKRSNAVCIIYNRTCMEDQHFVSEAIFHHNFLCRRNAQGNRKEGHKAMTKRRSSIQPLKRFIKRCENNDASRIAMDDVECRVGHCMMHIPFFTRTAGITSETHNAKTMFTLSLYNVQIRRHEIEVATSRQNQTVTHHKKTKSVTFGVSIKEGIRRQALAYN